MFFFWFDHGWGRTVVVGPSSMISSKIASRNARFKTANHVEVLDQLKMGCYYLIFADSCGFVHPPFSMIYPTAENRYTMRTEDVMRNKARAVAAWLGPFSNKTFSTFPEYEAFFDGENSIGDLSNFGRLKKELQCADFSSYIQRFSYLFLDGGLIPEPCLETMIFCYCCVPATYVMCNYNCSLLIAFAHHPSMINVI